MSDKLTEIRERWAKVTPGPWRAGRESSWPCPSGSGNRHSVTVLGEGRQVFVHNAPWQLRADNCAAIVAAPQDVAWLLAEVERLRTVTP